MKAATLIATRVAARDLPPGCEAETSCAALKAVLKLALWVDVLRVAAGELNATRSVAHRFRSPPAWPEGFQ
jgi:hypothetical protein